VSKDYYMACLDLTGRRCLVVGGGTVGLEKARGLLAAGAEVDVTAPEVVDELRDLPVRWIRARYASSDLTGYWLVIAATPDRAVNRRVFDDAEASGVFCNVADDPELCSFILPAIHRQGPIAVAVSTGGASPALAQRLRSEISELVTPRHAELAEELRKLRPWAREHLDTYAERKEFFDRTVEEALS
jgi:precorrin-2 dehydrogenase / sirohydrochlorin ferrochelatase